MVNVAVQVDAVRRHPQVAARLADGSVNIVGLFLDLATARLYLVDSDSITETDQHGAPVTLTTPK